MKKKMLKEQYARLFKGRVSSNDASLINEAKVEVTDHNDAREEDVDGTISGGEVTFEGTYGGMKWTATKEFLDDGAVFTSIYDAAGENLEDDQIEAYEDILDGIHEYMEEEGIEYNEE